jgi:hypothetical protein
VEKPFRHFFPSQQAAKPFNSGFGFRIKDHIKAALIYSYSNKSVLPWTCSITLRFFETSPVEFTVNGGEFRHCYIATVRKPKDFRTSLFCQANSKTEDLGKTLFNLK